MIYQQIDLFGDLTTATFKRFDDPPSIGVHSSGLKVSMYSQTDKVLLVIANRTSSLISSQKITFDGSKFGYPELDAYYELQDVVTACESNNGSPVGYRLTLWEQDQKVDDHWHHGCSDDTPPTALSEPLADKFEFWIDVPAEDFRLVMLCKDSSTCHD
jgi:hypothetical protein